LCKKSDPEWGCPNMEREMPPRKEQGGTGPWSKTKKKCKKGRGTNQKGKIKKKRSAILGGEGRGQEHKNSAISQKKRGKNVKVARNQRKHLWKKKTLVDAQMTYLLLESDLGIHSKPESILWEKKKKLKD